MLRIKFFLFFVFCSILFNGFSQDGLVPMISNLKLNSIKLKKNDEAFLKSNTGFDSTIIFSYDTLSLPFFDEFSLNRYQIKKAAITDLDLTFDLVYKLKDHLTDVPLANDTSFSLIQTYKRVMEADGVTFTDFPFTASSVKFTDLLVYPPVYSTIQVYPPFYIYDSLGVVGHVSDTVWMTPPSIVQDSAYQFFKFLNDTTKRWIDNYAFHNYDYAISPWSIGVMTFDGLDENGEAYAINSNSTDYADFLTSKQIDLSSNSAADSIYFSFLYQAAGYGEIPEAGDSLVLEFYKKDLDLWQRVWSTGGFEDTNFRVGHLSVKNVQYFTNAFQFRFKNYGHLSGGFDHFHLDYVSLKASSGIQDTLFKDFAWVYPVKTILKDYASVPWDHFKNNNLGKINDELPLIVRNGSNLFENNSLAGNLSVKYNGIVENSSTIVGPSLSNAALNYSPRTFYKSTHDFSNSLSFDISKLGDEQEFEITSEVNVQFPNHRCNDTTSWVQYFGNYYAYDDGTPEAAYGTTGTQSSLAVKFEAYEGDSLLGINTYFVEAANDVSDKLFLLTVWNDNNGVPGSQIYQDDIFFPRTPLYDPNRFLTYFFKDSLKLPVDEVFYIGWQQFDSDRLNIGFDKNTIKNDKVFFSLNDGVTWSQSQIKGVPMIRPLFSTALDATLGIENKRNELNVSIYPNPSMDGKFFIKGNVDDVKSINVYNLQGVLIKNSDQATIDLSQEISGVFIVEIVSEKSNKIVKIVKN